MQQNLQDLCTTTALPNLRFFLPHEAVYEILMQTQVHSGSCAPHLTELKSNFDRSHRDTAVFLRQSARK